MTSNQRAVQRARQLVGCRFRPQGRSASTGLDCVGLICCAFDISPACVPSDYRLRGDHEGRLRTELRRFFYTIPMADCRPGDVGLFEAGPDQMHLAVLVDGGFVHADAKLRKVVECPGTPPWPMFAACRRVPQENGKA